jgi:acetate---CoA ligase (ADP-forming)
MRQLERLFAPGSVAIVGASGDPSKWGNWLAAHALRGRHRRPVYLVNRHGGEILGQRSYPSLRELPEPVELAVIAVPAAGFEPAVDEALTLGARAIVGISAGLGESGPDGLARQRALVQRVRSAGAVLLGPNCLGLLDVSSELDLTSNDMPAGSVGLLSQSGNLALELSLLAARDGLGWSRFASLGNQADVDAGDLVRSYAEHPGTEVIAVYCEDFKDGRRFVAAAAEAAARGKPTVLLAVGASRAARRGARSHTGALASDAAVVDAACDAGGIVRVATPAQMVTVLQALAQPRRTRGRRVAVLADGGGHGAVAADLAESLGLEVPGLAAGLQGRLRAALPPGAGVSNPVDLAGAGEQDPSSFDRVLGLLAGSDEVDAVLVTGYFGGYGGYSPALAAGELRAAEAMARAVRGSAKPVVVHTMHAAAQAPGRLRSAGVPVYPTVDQAATALRALCLVRDGLPPGAPPLPAPQPPLGDAGYWPARDLLHAHGVPFVPGARVGSVGEALAAAGELGYPVALKAVGLDHKSDAGGVLLGLAGPEALAAAVAGLEARLGPQPMSVERMADRAGGVELLVGARWTPRFGPVVLAGLGGIHAEIFHDVALALAPLTHEQARRLLGSFRGAAVLRGARGRPAADVDAAAAAVAALSRAAAAHPEIQELEVNPLLATPHGAVGLDARVVLRPPTTHQDSPPPTTHQDRPPPTIDEDSPPPTTDEDRP